MATSVEPIPLDPNTQTKLRAVAQRLKYQGDDSAAMFDAMADFVGELAQAKAELAAAAQQPAVSEEALLRAVRQGTAANAKATVDAAKWQNVLIQAGLMVGALLIGGAAGYGICWRTTPERPSLTCRDSQGGRVCWYWPVQATEPAVQPTQPPPTDATPAPKPTKTGAR